MDLNARFDILCAHVARLEAKVSRLEGKTPSQTPEEALKNKRKFTVRKIVRLVADEYGVHPSVILGHDKSRRAAVPRQEVMRRALAVGWSSTQVGRALGRDHTTVLSGAKRARERLVAE